jgi:hypothetical protein
VPPGSIIEVVQKQTRLMSNERTQLQNVLLDFQQLFQGKHGEYNGEPLSLDLLPNSKPFHARSFSIPKAYQQVMKDRISWLNSIGILTQVASSKWAVPIFIIPKETETVQVIMDFCGLNKCLK